MTPAERVRQTAPERREQVVEAALRHFAVGGLHGTSTEDIAADTGLSQPYLFRLFGTKRELFLACCTACSNRVRETFADACAGDTPQDRLDSMGAAYKELLADEHMLRFQLQMYAAGGDPEIRGQVNAEYRALIADIRRLSGADEDATLRFVSVGMLLNVAASLGVDDILSHFKDE